jgi:hypothetical protein
MLQSMIKELDGLNPLQNKILMYCLGTPSATIMKPLCAQVEAKRRDQDDEDENKVTAFRYYISEIKSCKRRKYIRSCLGRAITEEVKLIKNHYLDLRAEHERIVQMCFETYLDNRMDILTKKEENGTPTGIIMRKYIRCLFNQGYTMLENETLWAKFSLGKLINGCNRTPLTIRYMNPEVFTELTNALNEMTKLRDKYYYY